MRTTTDIIFNQIGQTLSHRVMQGRPSACTYYVVRDDYDDTATPEWSGTATIDSVNTTVSSASGVSQSDPQLVNLTSTSSITTGKKYLISENSKQEWISPIEITGSNVRVRHNLKNDYTTSATLVGTHVTASVDSTFVQNVYKILDPLDPNPMYRVVWTVTVNGQTSIQYSYFSLVRTAVGYGVDLDDLNARLPGLMDQIPTEYRTEQGRPLLDAAFQSVSARLDSIKLPVDSFRDNQFIDELVTLRALNMLAEAGIHPLNFTLNDYVKLTQDNYNRFFEQHLQATENLHRVSQTQWSSANRPPDPAVWSK